MSFGPRPATAPVKTRSRQAAPPFIRPANVPSFTGSLDSVVDCSEKPKPEGVARANKSRCLTESAPLANKRHIHPAPQPTISEQHAVRKKLIVGHTAGPNAESPFPKKNSGKRPFASANMETEQQPIRLGKHVAKPNVARNPIVWGTPRVPSVRREQFRSNIIAWNTPRDAKKAAAAAPARKPVAAPYDVTSGGSTVFSSDVGNKPKFRKCFASVATRPKTARGLLTWA
jgi:hypothetical protein